MVFQSSAYRQDFLHCIKKVLERMFDSLEPSKREEIKTFPNITQQISIKYEHFLIRVGEYLFSCLFEGANPSRRAIALDMLNMIMEKFLVVNENTDCFGFSELKISLCLFNYLIPPGTNIARHLILLVGKDGCIVK